MFVVSAAISENYLCVQTVSVSAVIQSFNLISSFLLDDFPVQSMGQVQGAVQPTQQHLQQPGLTSYTLPSEEVPFTLHTQSKWSGV